MSIPLISAEQLGHKSGVKPGEGTCDRTVREDRELAVLRPWQQGAMVDIRPLVRRHWVGRGSASTHGEHPSPQSRQHPGLAWSTWEVSVGLGMAASNLDGKLGASHCFCSLRQLCAHTVAHSALCSVFFLCLGKACKGGWTAEICLHSRDRHKQWLLVHTLSSWIPLGHISTETLNSSSLTLLGRHLEPSL